MLVTGSSRAVADKRKAEFRTGIRLSRHNNARAVLATINFLLKTHVLPHAGAYGHYAKCNSA